MDEFSLLGLNLPLYVAVTLLFAYFIWSKFLKKGKLRPENIDDLSDIFAIFACIIVSLLSITSFVMIVLGILFLSLNIQGVGNTVPNLVTSIILLAMWIFTNIYRHRKASRYELKKEFIDLFRIYVLLVALFIDLCILIFITALKYVLWSMIALLPYILIAIFVCYVTIKSVLFNISFRRHILGKKFCLFVLLIMSIAFIPGYLSFPRIDYVDEHIYDRYHIIDPDSRWGEAYLQVKVPIDIETFGEFDLFIPIAYGNYNLETKGNAGKNFKIWINSTEKKGLSELIGSFEGVKTFSEKSVNKFGFTDAILHEDNGLIVLKFDKESIRDENIKQIILGGYVRKNVSELDYSYRDNSRYTETCNQKGCTFIFNISNNLDLPVYQWEEVLINFNNRNIENRSNCKFENLISNFSIDGKMRDGFCSGDSCELYIRDIIRRKDIFKMQLYVDEDNVWLHHIDIKEPIQVNAKVELIC